MITAAISCGQINYPVFIHENIIDDVARPDAQAPAVPHAAAPGLHGPHQRRQGVLTAQQGMEAHSHGRFGRNGPISVLDPRRQPGHTQRRLSAGFDAQLT